MQPDAFACAAFLEGGRSLVTGSARVAVWDLSPGSRDVSPVNYAPRGQERLSLEGHKDAVQVARWTADGNTIVSIAEDGRVIAWDAAAGSARFALGGERDKVRNFALDKSGRKLAILAVPLTPPADGEPVAVLKVVDLAKGSELATITEAQGGVRAAAFSIDGRAMASVAGDGVITLWDASTLAPQGHLRPARRAPRGRPEVPGRRQTVVGRGPRRRDPRLRRGESSRADALRGRRGPPHDQPVPRRIDDRPEQRVHPGQAILVHGHGPPVGRPHRPAPPGPPGESVSIAMASFSPTRPCWPPGWSRQRRPDLEPVRRAGPHDLARHSGFVTFIDFSPYGKLLATTGLDEALKLWEVATGGEVATLKGHRDRIQWVEFSPDGSTLATASRDNSIKLWDIPGRPAVSPPATKPGAKAGPAALHGRTSG